MYIYIYVYIYIWVCICYMLIHEPQKVPTEWHKASMSSRVSAARVASDPFFLDCPPRPVRHCVRSHSGGSHSVSSLGSRNRLLRLRIWRLAASGQRPLVQPTRALMLR